ncbi:MAG: O-antigen ligase family protein [Oscillospiraceae bacterium]|jgi:hypothetical protein|nr:O-antigen ligase family protein [Oscillospiraceae bacterium]
MPRTIFGTTEKSNFVLNMKDETFRKLVLILLGLLCLLTAAGGIVTELLQEIIFASAAGTWVSLVICGVLAMMLALVGLVKKKYGKSMLIPSVLCGFFLLFGLVSVISSVNPNVAFFGSEARRAGFMSLLFYAAFFFLGAVLNSGKLIRTFLNFFIIMGLLNCAWAAVQSTGLLAYELYPFRNLNAILLNDVFMLTGAAGNPAAFGILMSMCFAISLWFTHKLEKKKLLYCISAPIFVFFAIRSGSAAGILAVIAAIVIFILLSIKAKKDPGQPARIFSVGTGVIIALAAVGGTVFNYFAPLVYNTQVKDYSVTESNPFYREDPKIPEGMYFYDGAALWQDSWFRLFSSGPYDWPTAKFDIQKASSVYPYLWRTSVNGIPQFPLGIGPDCFVYLTMNESMTVTENQNSFDRPCNDYLYIAVTQGIPGLLAYLGLLGITFFRFAKRKRPNGIPAEKYAAAAALAVFAIAGFLGTDSMAVTPFAWIMLGTLNSSPES